MAGKLRYWKEKNGRFWARIAVPTRIRPFLDHPRSELLEPLGGDRRAALRAHPAAVARLQQELALAEQRAQSAEGATKPSQPRHPITTADFGRAANLRYRAALDEDDQRRERYPTKAAVDAEFKKIDFKPGAPDPAFERLAALDAALDYLVLREARSFDASVRKARLAALRAELAAGDTHQVEHEIDAYLEARGLSADRGTPERTVLATRMMRAEIEALKRTLERDEGDYGGQPSDMIVSAVGPTEDALPVSLNKLWSDYVESRVRVGFMKDGGKRQGPVISNLVSFLQHDDARRVTAKDLIRWRDHLLKELNLSAKTVSDIYLSTVRSLLSWAQENQLLEANVADKVRQPKARKADGREKGFTRDEAIAVLRACLAHVPRPNQFGFVKETKHMTAAKRWAPILAAFSGARISEITQLRKEDIRKEGDIWVMRITPDAGSVKAGGYRDVPLHRQVVALGFVDFVT